jgi:hypothetical protein
MSKDIPIIFSGPMVRALLDGRKTMTRRIMKLPKKMPGGMSIYEHPKMGGWEPTTSGGGGCFTIGKSGERIPAPEQVAIWHRTCGLCIVARYQPGDRLWVRERGWKAASGLAFVPFVDNESDVPPRSPDGSPYKPIPSIHMPRWASRLTLIVTAVKIERLQEISYEDALAEGCTDFAAFLNAVEDEPSRFLETAEATARRLAWPQRMFADLWRSLHGKDAWDANPFVVAISFSVEKQNIDTLPKAEAA